MSLAPALMIAFVCISPEQNVLKPTVDAMLLGDHVDPRLAENWSGVAKPSGEKPDAPQAIQGPPGPTCAELGFFDDFEIVEVIFGEQEVYILPPRMNNCGEIVFTRDLAWQTTSEIFRYDNGFIEQMTTNNTPGGFPDINDPGVVAWTRNYDGTGNEGGEIVMRQFDGDLVLGTGSAPRINEFAHVVWQLVDQVTCAFESTIRMYAGTNTVTIVDDGLSNQSPMINDSDEIVWTRYEFCPQPWVSQIGYYIDGQISFLPSGQTNPQAPTIDNTGRVAWSDFDFIEVWDGNQTTVLTEGHIPGLNDLGDVAYQDKTDFTPWQIWLYNDGNPCRLTSQEDIDNLIDNGRAEINNFKEVAWTFSPNGLFMPSGIRYLRRIRSGDLDLDDAVDFSDFAALPGCMTGVGDFDRLCDCRFLDMQHDRDVDIADALVFQNRYDKPTLAGDDCCLGHSSPGCNDPVVEACVCAQAPSCCADEWGDGCVLFADILGCADCLAPFTLEVSVQTPSTAASSSQWVSEPRTSVRADVQTPSTTQDTGGHTTSGTRKGGGGISGPNEITVGPGSTVAYEIVAQLSDDVNNDGLAGFSLDLKFAEVGLDAEPASLPPGMTSFAAPLGLTNPSGFGGVLESAALRQIGGLQNTFGDAVGATNSSVGGSPPPIGDVVTGIAHAPTVIATGTIIAPMEFGTYTLTIDNLAANALVAGPSPLDAWQTRQSGLGIITALTVIVAEPEPIPTVTTWGMAIMTLLIITSFTLLIRANVTAQFGAAPAARYESSETAL